MSIKIIKIIVIIDSIVLMNFIKGSFNLFKKKTLIPFLKFIHKKIHIITFIKEIFHEY